MNEARYEGFVPGRHLLDAVGNGGFRFAEMSHRGSILILPSGIYAWDVLLRLFFWKHTTLISCW